MSKIAHIVVCGHCPNLAVAILEKTLKPAHYCKLSNKQVVTNIDLSLPKWCELDDKPITCSECDNPATIFFKNFTLCNSCAHKG